MSRKLTAEEVQLFNHNGFLKLPDNLPKERVAAIHDAIEKNILDEVEPVVRNNAGRVVRISNVWDREPIFREVATCPEVLDPLESLLGPNIEVIKNRHNHATLRVAEARADYVHRDVLQWSRPILTVVFYLEDTNLENGCTRIIPGTHMFPWTASNSLDDDPQIIQTGVLDQAVPVPMSAGGLLALNSLVFHGGGTNKTQGTRMSMTVGYHSVDELMDSDNPKRILIRGERIYGGNDR